MALAPLIPVVALFLALRGLVCAPLVARGHGFEWAGEVLDRR
jgi:hypothetical protein